MNLPRQAQRLRIYIGESDRHHGRPLHEAIVNAARKRRMAGATVTRGILGYGAHSRIHTTAILRLSEDLPLVVEIVDAAEKVQAFLDDLNGMVADGMVTLEPVEVVTYRHE